MDNIPISLNSIDTYNNNTLYIHIQTKTDGFPPQIKALVGKDLKLKLEISKDNIVSKSRLYYAVDVLDTNTSSSAMSGATTSVYSTSTSLDVSYPQEFILEFRFI